MFRAFAWVSPVLALVTVLVACARPHPPAGSLPTPAELHVAVDGDDENPGTQDRPFRTLERARDALRALKESEGLPPGGFAVIVKGGDYELPRSFELLPEDSGSPGKTIIYRAASGEQVRLVGGKTLARWEPIQDTATLQRLDTAVRKHVLKSDLAAEGLAEGVERYPDAFRWVELPELFFEGRRMTVARWPNEGWTSFDQTIETGSRPRFGEEDGRPGVFRYVGNRPQRWSVSHGVWLHGYWRHDWYDEVLRVAAIDTQRRRIQLTHPAYYGIGAADGSARRYHVLNLLEELDRPGEYYVDPQAKMVYFWPPSDISRARVLFSTLSDAVVAIHGASNITLQGFTIEAGKSNGITVRGGGDNRIVACRVRNVGREGIAIYGGERHRVEACDIHDVGTSGVVLGGGDRRALLPARHEAINNHIHHFARRQRTYAAGVKLDGVGIRIAHNRIHDAPHTAILLEGNDHLIELNEVHHACLETDDCGAFYMGRNPSERGTVIRHNFWHHVGGVNGLGTNAIYLDDGTGGQTVSGNVFFRCGQRGRADMGALFCNGGHDNHFENNIIVECERALAASRWEDRRWRGFLRETLLQTRLLEEVDITGPIYRSRYPELEGFMTSWERPRVNFAKRNIVVGCNAFARGNYTLEDNLVLEEDPGFVDPRAANFQLRDDSIIFEILPEFEPIPFAKIGLYRDAYRPVLPPVH